MAAPVIAENSCSSTRSASSTGKLARKLCGRPPVAGKATPADCTAPPGNNSNGWAPSTCGSDRARRRGLSHSTGTTVSLLRNTTVSPRASTRARLLPSANPWFTALWISTMSGYRAANASSMTLVCRSEPLSRTMHSTLGPSGGESCASGSVSEPTSGVGAEASTERTAAMVIAQSWYVGMMTETRPAVGVRRDNSSQSINVSFRTTSSHESMFSWSGRGRWASGGSCACERERKTRRVPMWATASMSCRARRSTTSRKRQAPGRSSTRPPSSMTLCRSSRRTSRRGSSNADRDFTAPLRWPPLAKRETPLAVTPSRMSATTDRSSGWAAVTSARSRSGAHWSPASRNVT